MVLTVTSWPQVVDNAIGGLVLIVFAVLFVYMVTRD
jgi:hypothetical protein